jgi:NAD(P)H-dependent FMN reductase
MSAPRLLIVWHSRTGAARAMADALAAGAEETAGALEQGLDIDLRRAAATDPGHVLAAQGYLFCAPENLASLSGEMKEFFDRCYYAVLDRIGGRPFGVAISAGTDGSGAVRQVQRICTGWRLHEATPPLIVRNGAQSPEQILADKSLPEDASGRCRELGGLLAALLLIGS